MIRAALLLLPLSAASCWAQAPAFDCVGAAQLEDDVFAIPFARGSASLSAAAEPGLEAALALALAEPGRMICVLGHAGGQEGGANAARQLAAQRASAVAEALATRGMARDRLRAEVRTTAFTRAAAAPAARSVAVVVLPP